ncbi:MAG: hypothetical protein PHV77_04930 [Candidatus Omnitrophica bacterium]|jgi:hypothetical protein|nr:hypothetical protein [Candidatus Omnitrophota bacterium]
MNKDIVYVSVFGVLCALAGVLVGAGITSRLDLGGHFPQKAGFSEKARRFMWQYQDKMPQAPDKREDRLFAMLTTRLGLDRDQQIRVKVILDKTRRQIDAISRDVRSSILVVKDGSDKEIMDILTSQQQAEFRKLLKEFDRRRCFVPCRDKDQEPAKDVSETGIGG